MTMGTTALTEEGTSKTIEAGGMKIHYHEAGEGEPVIFLHAYGPGTTAWINYCKNIEALSKSFRCLLVDMAGSGRTVAPALPDETGHYTAARTALTLMDALGIEKASIVGNSMGGTSALVFGFMYPDRVNKIVTGSCHHSTSQSSRDGGEPYMIASRPSEGNRAAAEVTANPTKENFRRYLKVHLDNEALVTDELIDYVHAAFTAANANRPPRTPGGGHPHSNLHDLWDVKAPTLIIYGRYDRMCSYEVGLTILNYVANSRMVLLNNCGHWPAYEKPEEYNAYVEAFLKTELSDRPHIARAFVPV